MPQLHTDLASDSQQEDGLSTEAADASLHRRPEPAAPDPLEMPPGLGARTQSSATAHRNPPQPTRGLPSPCPIPQAQPSWAQARTEWRAPTRRAMAPGRWKKARPATRATQAHCFPSLTMATPGTRKQQSLLLRSRPPSGDAAFRTPPSLAPPSAGRGFSIGLLKVSRGLERGGRLRCVVDGAEQDEDYGQPEGKA